MTAQRKPPNTTAKVPIAVNRRHALECLIEWAEGDIAYYVHRCWKHVEHPDADDVASAAQDAVRSILYQILDTNGGEE